MDIEKILVLIRLCTKKILNDLLKSQDTMMFSYAFEFQLILVGERINSVIDEIEIFLFKNTQLFINLLNQATVQFDEARILNVKEEDYKRRLFRQTFNKTNIGSGLMLLNTLQFKASFPYFG